jgi:signal transduction histidine kinase
MGALLGLGAPLGFLALRRLLGGGRRRRAWPFRARSDDGLALLYMTVGTPIAFGIFGHALGQHEEQLRASSRQIERLREEFAAVVAHDLRTPIQSILLQLDTILRGVRDSEVQVSVSKLRKLRHGGERLAHMVNDLLDATRIEVVRLSLQPEIISLPEAVRNLVDRVGPTLGDHPVEVVVEGAPPRVAADPARLDQILTNLLENAAKYSDNGRPITVRVRPDGTGVLLSVEDQGTGIAADEVPKLFDRFYQAKRARLKKSGLGLGLYITKGLVEAHGGRITVYSVPNEGSSFRVWLPAQQ